ncbi:hypothetical protein [Streptomyces sp. V1I6]|jgi:hypothetical protein|uniref:hypothetical protein n=1 Tax=Streptomyces sp. V1I6 TaxID=3042273 RepID=UPI002781DFCE|nr:hypothetical protein [Streptomyces sp. V1I6]MDQ0842405.1 hypothetical protein [Streptomyces sp. V1I6]
MPEKDEDKTAPKATTSAAASSSSSSASPKKSSGELSTGALAVDADDPKIDPRLDNRTGDQRPKLEDFPAKPQQIDGPEVGEEQVRPAKRRRAVQDRGPAKGAKSPGPHGLGDTADKV